MKSNTISTAQKTVKNDAGAAMGTPDTGAEPDTGTRPAVTEPRDAGSVGTEPANPAQPTDPAQPTTPPAEPSQTGDPDCTRAVLFQKAEAYMRAMESGETSSLTLHAMVRYTENGNEVQLGGGVWMRLPKTTFARHVVDEVRCSSMSEAVLSSFTGDVVFGVRLLYRDGQLLEIEAHVVPDTLAAIDVEGVIPIGTDHLIAPVTEERRMSREELEAYAERYFDAAVNGGEVPPSEPSCRRRQNGLPLGDGRCDSPPGTMRFEQRRYPVLDEITGIITASVLYDNHLGLYFIKMAGDTVQTIEIVGGATTTSSGW